MSLAKLHIAAAGYVLGWVNAADLRRAADEAFVPGVYSFKENGIPFPTVKVAANRLLWHNLGRLIEETIAPLDGFYNVRFMLEHPTGRDGGADADEQWAHRLRVCADRYGQLPAMMRYGLMTSDEAEEAVEDVHREVRRICGEWLASHAHERVDPAWLVFSDRVVWKLALAIRDERRFIDLPRLADALREAGCTDPELLEHCFEQTSHGSDCWVIHLLLAGA